MNENTEIYKIVSKYHTSVPFHFSYYLFVLTYMTVLRVIIKDVSK